MEDGFRPGINRKSKEAYDDSFVAVARLCDTVDVVPISEELVVNGVNLR